MRGHDQILASRRRGLAPKAVHLADTAPLWVGHVQYEPEDIPKLADLRFVVGLLVFVTGLDSERVSAWAQACEAAKARRVVTAVFEQPDPQWRAECVQIGDSTGQFTWSKPCAS